MSFAKYPVSGGGGSITGPGSSTNNALVLWNGTGGNTIKDGGVGSDRQVLTSNGTTPTWSGSLALGATSNQIAFGSGANRITLNVPNNPAANLVYSMPNNVAASATFAMLEASQTFTASQTMTGNLFLTANGSGSGLFLGTSPNRVVIDPGVRTISAQWTFPDTGDSTFAALEGTQSFTGNKTFAGTLTTPSSFTIGANTFARSGAHSLTLTTTNTTNITLPTTGTLATLAGSETLTNKTLTSPILSSTFTIGADSFTRSGAHGLTLTTTALTNVTLPTTGTLATLAGSETLTNKTITAPILNTHIDYTAISTPSSPGAGVLRVYSKSDERLYRVNSSGLEVPIGGGLDPVERSTTLSPAVAGTLYICNTFSGGFTITLPTGSAKASIGFLDARETWGTNNLTIAPATGETIDGQAANETLVLDVSGSWVILTWDSVNTRWVVQSSAPGSSNQAIVQGGNTLGAAMTIGTNDNFGLNLETNGTTKVSIGTDGILSVINGTNGRINVGASNNYVYGDSSNNLILGTAGTDKLSITSAGALTAGPIGFTGTHTLNGRILTTSSSTSCASSSTTSVLTLSTLADGFYLVTTAITGFSPAQVGVAAILSKIASNSVWTLTVLQTASTLTLSENDTNLQVNQTTGSTQTVATTVLRIA